MPIETRPDQIHVARLADDPRYTADLEALARLALGTPGARAALDFAGVTYLNSSNLARLLRFRKSMIEHDGKLALFGMNGPVASVFHSTALDRVFVITRDEAGALLRLGA
jgi:anti-anti-sigma factor